ncbi:MAG: hypothetical protein PCFJNLEI_02855 [Verrucomicrobiae bacterium]|nr:hypothetical protein [Verrucomicrobiae bacterium]
MKHRLRCVLSSIGIYLASVLLLTADDLQSLKNENAELRQLLNKLNNEIEHIKGVLTEKGLPIPATPTTTKNVTAQSFDLQLYGLIKLDAAHDDSRVSAGNFARWVESEGVLNNDAQFNMTANQTRLGLRINGPNLNGIKTAGQVEIDFYGAGAAENKPDPMLRHAFVKADWSAWNFSLLAGQTADIISPLAAPTVNYSVCWWQGNIGYRRAQLRLTKAFKPADDIELKLEAGPTRTITDRKFVYTGSTDPDSGADSEFPSVQGRVSLSFPSFNRQPATVGLSGHWGQEDQHQTNALGVIDSHLHFDSWSANVDVRLPVTDWLLLQGEGFIGENLSAYLGGIGQGFDPVTQDTIAALGGWTAVSLGPWGKWQFNLGAGIDTVNSDDVGVNAKAPPRLSNYVYFGNCNYTLTTNLQLAFEIAYLRTAYKQAVAGDAWREQLAVIYKF